MESWRRGSTPVNIFNVNIDLTQATVYVSYSQNGQVIVEKTGNDLVVTENSITVQLTQEDTLKFATGNVEIQIRYVMTSGMADASNIMNIASTKILKEGKITHV